MANWLWYLDPFWTTLEERSIRRPQLVQGVYNQEESKGSGYMYNDYKAKKKVKPSISVLDLKSFNNTATAYIDTVWLNSPAWKPVRQAIAELRDAMGSYITYLDTKSKKMMERHNSLQPARTPIEDGQCYTVEGTVSEVLPMCVSVMALLEKEEVYKPIFLNDLLELETPEKKYKYVKKLLATQACSVCSLQVLSLWRHNNVLLCVEAALRS